MSAGSKLQRAGAGAVLAMVAAGLGLLAWVFFELQGRYGPSYGARLDDGRIGTDGETLYVEDVGGKFQSPLAEVLYSNRRLLVGSQLVFLRVPGGDRYPSERVAASILARLPASA